jgi:hypothetical protein
MDNAAFLFKGLGKVLYRKHYNSSNNEDYTKEKFIEREKIENCLSCNLVDKKRPPLSQQPEDLYVKLSISSDTILLYLHQNYIDMFLGRNYTLLDYTFESVISISESLVASDLLSKHNKSNSFNNSHTSEYSSIIAMRALLFNLYLSEEQIKANSASKSMLTANFIPLVYVID